MPISARTLVAAMFGIAVLACVAATWLRERAAQRRMSAGAAKLVTEKLGGWLLPEGAAWRVTANLDGRPVMVAFGGRFIFLGEGGHSPDFVPTVDIEVPCATAAKIAVHGNWPGGRNYIRNITAKVRGSRLLTGDVDFDGHFIVEGESPSDAAIVDSTIRKRLLASKNALYGRSWALEIRGGTARLQEVFSEDSSDAAARTAAEVAEDVLARLSLVREFADSAERRKPGTNPIARTSEHSPGGD